MSSVSLGLLVAKCNAQLKKGDMSHWDSLIYNVAKMNFARYVTSYIMKSLTNCKTDFLRAC